MSRAIQFFDGEFYHVYNRGANKLPIIRDADDANRFIISLGAFNSIEPIQSLYVASFTKNSEQKSPLVHLIAYCLNPNHYHLLLQQAAEGGISEFMKRLGGGYTWYFNHKYKRNGVLFQGKFKAVRISSNESLLNVSAYVNLNNHIHQLSGPTAKLVRSSWNQYSGEVSQPKNAYTLCESDVVAKQFKSKGYARFAIDAAQTLRRNKELRKESSELMLESFSHRNRKV